MSSMQDGPGKYVLPPMRVGASEKSWRDEIATVKVTNLSENTTEQNLYKLVRAIGPVRRVYVTKDKKTRQCKGFAFVNFKRLEDAAKAIHVLNGYSYYNLFLKVEWAKSSGNHQV